MIILKIIIILKSNICHKYENKYQCDFAGVAQTSRV